MGIQSGITARASANGQSRACAPAAQGFGKEIGWDDDVIHQGNVQDGTLRHETHGRQFTANVLQGTSGAPSQPQPADVRRLCWKNRQRCANQQV